jgi:hypothetical protein
VKSICPVALAAALLVLSTGAVAARAVRLWSYQELLDRSDLVVIATLAGASDTKEHIDLPGFSGEQIIGVETKFSVSAVLKGDEAKKEIVLHHYRPADRTPRIPNGPTYVSFSPAGNEPGTKPAYLLFLVGEADGRYAPVVGQTDPALGIRQLARAVGEPTKISTEQFADILKQCATINSGMTRADLSKVFYPEGGLSTAKHRSYCYCTVPYIKVDVDFTLTDPKHTTEQPTDIIAKISKPYLEWGVAD